MYQNVKKVLSSILNRFKAGEIPKAIAYSMYPIPDIPASKWSLCNRTLMFFAGTQDGRGYEIGQDGVGCVYLYWKNEF